MAGAAAGAGEQLAGRRLIDADERPTASLRACLPDILRRPGGASGSPRPTRLSSDSLNLHDNLVAAEGARGRACPLWLI